MYSTEQRRVAIETFIRFDYSYADTIAELGYPNRHTLNLSFRQDCWLGAKSLRALADGGGSRRGCGQRRAAGRERGGGRRA